MLERDVDRKFTNGLKQRGLTSIKLSSFGAHGCAGWPDRLVLGPGGIPVFVELKAPGGKASPLQLERQAVLNRFGFFAATFDDPDAALEYVSRVRASHVLMDYDPTPGGARRCKR